jgi:hypothetical protein
MSGREKEKVWVRDMWSGASRLYPLRQGAAFGWWLAVSGLTSVVV